MYNTIIVPTDFSNEDLTIQSLKKAENLSEQGHIILLHILEDVPYDVLKTRSTLDEWINKSGVKAEVEVRDGGSYHNIIESAKANNADLILINPHKPGFGDYLLGSTTSKVVRHAPCAVLVDR
ncbi:universal stress protein [Leucothrix arctica]|uniref:Universal stress protein n=1 Tax=Leucothrix arctica TaxID=1481894 RepID=A0A317C570_9GAMM|nr:universal stress protein [Leucothrix arctica]PWQ93805.1 universal stress protein [Leucothrix arctica]